jgi:uncharacterized protein (DUF1810 family)
VHDPFDLQRFVDAQQITFDAVIAELQAGRKTSHWMWFIFPQLTGLGHSPVSQYYALGSLVETRAYLEHELLAPRLQRCTEILLSWSGLRTAEDILGPVDSLKLRSSLTLFDLALPDALFKEALDGFFDGRADQRTLALLNARG